MNVIRLLIIAPDMMVGSLLAEAFSREEDFAILDVLTASRTFLGDPRLVDVIVLHAEAHANDLITPIHRLHQQLPRARIVLVHPPGVRDIHINALEAGASGFVGQDETVAEIVQVIRTVHLRGASIDPDLAHLLVERVTALHRQVAHQYQAGLRTFDSLSEREWDVLRLVSEDLSNAEIADRLFISVGTVKNHVHKVLTKLNAENRDQAGDWYRWHQRYHGASQASDGEDAEPMLSRGSLLAASRMPGLRAMIQDRLTTFCDQLGWPVGHIFLLDDVTGELTSTGIWHLRDPENCAAFRELTERMRIRPREGVLGEMLASPAPAWVEDVGELVDEPRTAAARAAGLQSGLFLPFVDGDLIGAFEFYATERDRPSPDTIADIMQTGRQIGEQLESSR